MINANNNLKQRMMMDVRAIQYCINETQLKPQQVEQVIKLLIVEECTVPFVARYRKEVTGNLDETQIRAIESAWHGHQEIEKRRSFIMETLHKGEQLTPELVKLIAQATDLAQLEDIYAPFKSKRKTKAAIAKEKGLEPLALEILSTKKTIKDLAAQFKPSEEIKTFEEAVEGAQFIMIEKMAHHLELKNELRTVYEKDSLCVSSKTKDADQHKEATKFRDYFEFSEPFAKLNDAKASHRFLALCRGKELKILKFSLNIDAETALRIGKSYFIQPGLGCEKLITETLEIALKSHLQPSLESEMMSRLKATAEEAAIKVFASNLKNLLLAPYLGSKIIMGVDPGIRTGCKVVIIDKTGQFVVDHVVYLEQGPAQRKKAQDEIEKMLEAFQVEFVCIGDGTYGRETLAFFEDEVKQVKDKKITATLVSESGASVYSASEAAIEEFPKKDVTVRGAISIARRFQDPLSELVKIDPKSIGVGQYQHDVNENKLKTNLGHVVEDCVNFVGVDLNTASYHVLSFISGIGKTLAQNIVKYRQKNGLFKNRKELLSVGRFSEKIFEQSAGFLRIYGGENPLDATFVHPERFAQIEKWCFDNKIQVKNLVQDPQVQERFAKDQSLKNQMGEHTFNDIVKSLKAPTQDPRTVFKSTDFDREVRTLEEVKVGKWYTGVINNITNFGAFVNIGIKESGLVHISQLSDQFVTNPMDVVKVGQEVRVKVVEVDLDRRRLALSCKSDDKNAGISQKSYDAPKPNHKAQPKNEIKPNNPFGKLKNFKV
ncbi:MAG: RNA-binding transcriptional accessory protein [Bacteriovoracaceae bacterium]|nr:RNA-binding transcriptional accessory protein [Bacteriovoracaceae bacterium]